MSLVLEDLEDSRCKDMKDNGQWRDWNADRGVATIAIIGWLGMSMLLNNWGFTHCSIHGHCRSLKCPNLVEIRSQKSDNNDTNEEI